MLLLLTGAINIVSGNSYFMWHFPLLLAAPARQFSSASRSFWPLLNRYRRPVLVTERFYTLYWSCTCCNIHRFSQNRAQLLWELAGLESFPSKSFLVRLHGAPPGFQHGSEPFKVPLPSFSRRLSFQILKWCLGHAALKFSKPFLLEEWAQDLLRFTTD